MSRAQRILQCVAGRPFPCVFDMIFKAVRAGEPEETRDNGSLRAAVSAQLKQLVDAKKLRRTGSAGAYLYHATKLTHVDLRKVDADGNARDKSARRRPNARKTVAPPTPPRPVAAKPARLVTTQPAKVAGERPLSPTFQISKPAPAPKPQRESVEAFLKRGGRIQKLRNGEVSQPLQFLSLREHTTRNKPKAKKRAAKPTTTD